MNKIRASKCEIREVPASEQREFLNSNHIQGYVACSVCLGLYYNDRLVYLQSYGKTRRANITYADWDMKRMCGLKDSYIYGGASKLLKYFLQHYNIGNGLVTYCDPEEFTGGVYPKLGFKQHHICPDDYRYVKNGKVYSKQYGKKSEIYDRIKPDEPFEVWKTKHTEREMMDKLGYTREWHKGLIAYIIEPKYYIYEIEVQGYHYIGQHKYQLLMDDGYTGSGIALHNIQQKYNDMGKKTIIESDLSKQEADEREKYWIAQSRKKYGHIHEGGKNCNIADGGQGGLIVPMTEEIKGKISNTLKQYFSSNEQAIERLREDGSKWMKEHPEHLQKMIDGRNNTSWNKGKHWNEEVRQKISQAKAGKKHKNQAPMVEGLTRMGDMIEKTKLSRAQIMKRWTIVKVGVWSYVDENKPLDYQDQRGKWKR